MKTTYQTTQNVSRNESVFRGLAGISLISAVVAGTVASPGGIFVASLLGIYLVITAIVASDPFYAVSNSLSKVFARKHGALAAS